MADALPIRRRSRHAYLAVLLLPFAFACDDEEGVFEPPRSVESIELVAPQRVLVAGSTIRLDVLARDARGVVFEDPPVELTSSDPSVLTVSQDGTVEARQAGSARIIARAGGLESDIFLEVIPGAATSLDLVVESGADVIGGVARLEHGDTAILGAAAQDVAGNPAGSRFVNFFSLNPGIASVDGQGMLVARSPGTARIVAELDFLVDTLTVEVLPSPRSVAEIVVDVPDATLLPGESVQLTATALNFQGEAIAEGTLMPNGEVLTFDFSANPRFATVTEDGLVTVVGMGMSDILVTVPSIDPEAVSGRATLTVGPVTHFTPASGLWGSTVTLTGFDLELVEDVAIDGVSTQIQSRTADQITVWVPVGAGEGPVTVTFDGEQVSSVDDFTVSGGGDIFDPASDAPGTAPVVTPGFHNPQLYAATEGDREDWYVLDMQGETDVTITMPFDPPDFDLYVYERGADGSVGGEITHSWFDNPEVISLTGLDPNGTYYIIVDAYDGDGRYALTITSP